MRKIIYNGHTYDRVLSTSPEGRITQSSRPRHAVATKDTVTLSTGRQHVSLGSFIASNPEYRNIFS